MGGKTPLRVFLQGNEDLSTSLLGEPEAFPIELSHEPGARSDVLLQQIDGATVPEELPTRDWGKDANFLASQFHSHFFEGPSDVVVLSVQPELSHSLWMHRRSRYLLSPPPRWGQDWAGAQRTWFVENFVPRGFLSAGQLRENWMRLIRAVKERLDAHVLICNVSTIEPDDQVHNYHGRKDTWALRAHQVNLALLELSVLEGISLIDTERLVAEHGAYRHVLQAGRYSREVNEAIRTEFLRVLDDVGFFENRPLVMQVGRRNAPCS
jgi:hypothetical protein